jgi:hypothetical protein
LQINTADQWLDQWANLQVVNCMMFFNTAGSMGLFHLPAIHHTDNSWGSQHKQHLAMA